MKKKLIFVGALLVVSSQIFAQQETENQIEEVTIASKTPQQIQETGKNVKLLSAKDLEKYKGQNLNEVLDQVAGVQISGTFNGQNEPKMTRIRGGKNANVLILLDGVPLKDVTGNDYTAGDLRMIALENVESIEMLNGASSVLYGSNATVSVINIKTKKSAQRAVEGIVSARGGSYNTFAQNGSVRGRIRHFNYQVNGFNEKSDGFSSAEGDESFDKDGWEKQNISASAGFSTETLGVNLNGGWNHNLYKFDSGAFADGYNRNKDRQFFLGGNAYFNYNQKGSLHLNIRYTNTDRLTQDLTNKEYVDQYQYGGDNFFLDLYNNYKFNEFFSLIGGLQYEKQSMESYNLPWGGTGMEQVLDFDDTNVTTYDVYANAQLKYSVFRLDLGGRLTNHSKFNNHFVYSVNPYIYSEFDNMYFKGGYSYSTAFIAPTLYQSFGSKPYVISNFDLKPETNQSHELNVDFGKKDRSMHFAASIFLRQEKDVFKYVSLPDYTGVFENVDQNKVKGVEVSADYQIVKYIKVGANYSYVEKENTETMLRQPKIRVNSYIEVLPFTSTRISLSHMFVGKRPDYFYDASFNKIDVVADQFNLFNLNVNQKITPEIEAYLNVGNLFNTSYVDVVGYTTKARNFTFGVSYKF